MAKDPHDKLYTGVTENPKARVKDHNRQRGANFTKRGLFKTVFLESYETLAQARQREIQIKKWRRDKKNMLIDRYLKGLPTERQH